MVGGRIVSIRPESDRLCVIVAKKVYSRHEFCGVDIALNAHPIKLGDSLWWQGDKAFWTPDGEKEAWDVPIPKIGYSYSTGLNR